MPKVLIIGSGLGGLSTGAMLARKGFDVTVLEQGSQIGGCLQCFERDGVRFETGMHVVGSVKQGEVLHNHLDNLGIADKVQFSQLDTEAYDIVSIGGERFHFANGHEEMIEQMLRRFPDQRDNLRRYWALVDSVARQSPMYDVNGYKGIEAASKVACVPVEALMTRSINSVIDETISDPLLRQVLVGNIPLFAGVRDKTPFATHAFVADFYNRGAYRVVGGSDAIAKALCEKIRVYGGEVITGQRVTHVNCSNGKVNSLDTADGQRYHGDIIISDIHPQQLLNLFDDGSLRSSYTDRIRMMPNTQAVFSLFLKFKSDRVPYLNSNFFCYRSTTPWTLGTYNDSLWPDGYLYMQNDVRCKMEDGRCGGGIFAQGAVMLAYMNFADVARWIDTRTGRRGEDYEAFKRRKAEAMIDALEEQFPGTKQNIDAYWTATPLTYRDYTSTPFGSMYGILHDVNLGVGGRISYRTKLPNFFLTGQNINAHGILGVLIGSYNVCEHICSTFDVSRFTIKNVESNSQFSILNSQFSILIIGGGLGGLLTGALMAKKGHKVTVLEKNRIIGGGIQMFSRYGHSFPTGMHVFGGMHEGGILRELCDELGISDKICATPTDEDCFDEVIVDSKFKISNSKSTIRLPRGKERYIAYLSSLFPHQRENIRAYVEATYALTAEELSSPESPSEQFLWPADKLISHYITDPELQGVLSYLAPLYSGIAGETPAYVHAIVNTSHIEGSFMFAAGSQKMADSLAEVIRDNGGEVIAGEEVTSIEAADHNVTAVLTASRRRYHADRYISDIDPQRLVEIAQQGSFPPSFCNRIKSATYSYSAFKVYFSLKSGMLPHVNHPRYYLIENSKLKIKNSKFTFDVWNAADVRLEEWPRCMMAVTGRDGRWKMEEGRWKREDGRRKMYADTLTVMIPTPYEWFSQWADSKTWHRPDDYYAFKEKLQQRVVDLLCERIPELASSIDKVFSSTPLTIRDWLGVPYGSLYGFQTDCNHPLYTKLSVNTKLRNLYMTGQNVNLHGMCGVAITAKITALNIS